MTTKTEPQLPEKLFVRERRDIGDMDCVDFTTKPLQLDQMAQCDTDGHYRCKECSWRNPDADNKDY